MPPFLVRIHPISLWPVGSVDSALVLPSLLDESRLHQALKAVLAKDLYPVLTARFTRLPGARGEGEYAFALDDTVCEIPYEVVVSHANSPPFSDARVVQASLDPFVPTLDVGSYLLPDPMDHAPLLSVRLTLLPELGQSVLGCSWGHVLGDGAAALRFLEVLSALYVDSKAVIEPKPVLGPHIPLDLPLKPLSEHENSMFTPSFGLAEGWERYGASAAATEEVHLTLSAAELETLKGSVKPGEGWVSTQDSLTSYLLHIGEIIGEGADLVINSVNYRTFPNLPPSLPTLIANVAQLLATPLSASGSIARTLRRHLLAIREDPLPWLETAAHHLHGATERGEICVMVPNPREWVINSNYRYNWTKPSFGTPAAAYHTAFTVERLVRVFRTNDRSGGAECCFRLRTKGGAAKFLAELEQDRAEAFKRWKGVL